MNMSETQSKNPVSSLSWWVWGIPFVLLFVIYLPALQELVITWATDDNYSHGFLIPVVCTYLAWGKRKEIAALPKQIDSRGLFLVIAGMLLFVVANGAAEYFTLRVSFVMCLTGLLWYFFGGKLIRIIWFECFFLLFMIPIPYVLYYSVAFPMQMLATKITVVALKFLGAAVIQQGNIIHIADYSLEVAEACSGVRSLMALIALGALYAHSTQEKLVPKALLFISTIPIAVIANVFRVLVTSILVYTISPAAAEEPVHSIMGMMVFVVAFIMLFIFGAILKRIFK